MTMRAHRGASPGRMNGGYQQLVRGEPFVDINTATETDFRKATQRVWHTAAFPSKVRLSVLSR